MVNCSREPPYAEDFVRGMGPVVMAFIVLLSLLTLATCGIFVELWVYLTKHVNSSQVKGYCLLVLGLLPAISIVAQLGITVPRTAMLAELISSVSTGMGLFAFLRLTVAYLGGTVQMLEQMQRVDAILRAVFLLPIMHFIVAVVMADGKNLKDKMGIHNPVMYIRIMMVISTILSVYVFNILVRTGLQIADQPYQLLPKYIIVMAMVLINNIQPQLIYVLTKHNVIPCTDAFNWTGRGSVFNHMGTVAEAFILMLLARRFYRKPYPQVEMITLPSTHTLPFSQ